MITMIFVTLINLFIFSEKNLDNNFSIIIEHAPVLNISSIIINFQIQNF